VVLAELITQSKYQGRSRASEYVALAVRLLAAVGAERNAAETVLTALAELWTQPRGGGRGDVYGMEAFRSLLDIPSAHRALFRTKVLSDPSLAREFGRRYAVLAAGGETGLYSGDWRQLADELPPLAEESDPVYVWFDVQRKKQSPEWGVSMTRGRDLLRLRSGGTSQAGVFWHWLSTAPSPPDESSERIMRRVMKESLKVLDGEDMHDASLVPSDPALLRAASPGALCGDLALILMLLTRGEFDSVLGAVAGRELAGTANAIRLIASKVAASTTVSQDDFDLLRRAVRKAYASALKGRIPAGVWQYVGLSARRPRQ